MPAKGAPKRRTQDRFQRSETSVHSMDSGPNPRPFPFFKLPAELRSEIYRLVVISGRSLIVQDMNGWGIEKIRGNYTYKSRSTYLATDHVCGEYSWPDIHGFRRFIPCALHAIDSRPVRTTYALGAPRLNDGTTKTELLNFKEDRERITMTMKMLSLNKDSREEVAFIFYGENTFHFNTMSSLVPFMKDRTEETRKHVKSIRLILTVYGRSWDAFTDYGRPATWNTALSTFAKLPHVNIKQLCVQIDDKEANVLMCGLDLKSRSMLWLHKLSKIENLEMLGVRHDVGGWIPLSHRPSLLTWGPADKTAPTRTEQELWRFLAPRMLRKEADDHSPEALQKRRICDS